MKLLNRVGAIVLGATLALATGPVRAEQMILIGTLRDFHAGGDFENDYNGQYPLITGMVKPDLGSDGKPVLNVTASPASATVQSSRTDLSSVTLKLSDGSSSKSNASNRSATVTAPAGHEGATITEVDVKLSGSSSTYKLTPDDLSVRAGRSTISATLSGGTNIPGQWRISSLASFKQWFQNVPGVNLAMPYTLVLDNNSTTPGGIYSFARSTRTGQSFFPLDNQAFGNEGRSHNYHFTFEVHTKFTYTDPATRNYRLVFNFSGDDDVWVFINHKLAIDLGGVHPEQFATVDVDSLAQQLGLQAGKSYDFDFFYCERHTVESNLTIQTTMQFLPPLYD